MLVRVLVCTSCSEFLLHLYPTRELFAVHLLNGDGSHKVTAQMKQEISEQQDLVTLSRDRKIGGQLPSFSPRLNYPGRGAIHERGEAS